MIACCDYYNETQTLPPNNSCSTTYSTGHGWADNTTWTLTWGDGWYTSTSTPVQEEPIIVKKQNRDIFTDRKNIYKIEKPIMNNIPRKRIHNRFGRVCIV